MGYTRRSRRSSAPQLGMKAGVPFLQRQLHRRCQQRRRRHVLCVWNTHSCSHIGWLPCDLRRSGCPFCKNAKALLTDVGADFLAVELDTLGQEGKAIRAELAEVSVWGQHKAGSGWGLWG